MRTDKENQHYLPKFYLLFFSIFNNGKPIALYNLDNKLFIPEAKIKTQGSKKFYYGMDGIIKDKLMHVENHIAPSIHNIIRTSTVPKRNSVDHDNLLFFIALTIQRNPVSIDFPMQSSRKMLSKLDDIHGKNVGFEDLIHQNSKEESIELNLSSIRWIADLCKPLEFKLLSIVSGLHFIASDFPVIRYNQFLEGKNWRGGDNGFGTVGIQIFLPLTNKLMIVLYDQGVYKLGNKRDKVVNIDSEESINQLNKLQLLNCTSQLFFNHEITKQYIEALISKTKFKNNQERVKLETGTIRNPDGTVEKDALIILGQENIRTNLKVQKLIFNKKGKKKELTNSMAQLRLNIEHLMNWPK